MPETMETRHQIRFDLETTRRIEELARIWGPVEPLTRSAVVRRAVELAHRRARPARRPKKAD